MRHKVGKLREYELAALHVLLAESNGITAALPVNIKSASASRTLVPIGCRFSNCCTSSIVKVCGWRPHDGGAANTGSRRPQTSKGGNRGRFGEAARQTLWGFWRRRSVAEVC